MTRLVAFLIAYPFIAVLRGWVIAVMWGWFVVPAFGLPALGLIHAIGISLLVSLFTSNVPEKDDEPELLRPLLYIVTVHVITLGFGFAWSLLA